MLKQLTPLLFCASLVACGGSDSTPSGTTQNARPERLLGAYQIDLNHNGVVTESMAVVLSDRIVGLIGNNEIYDYSIVPQSSFSGSGKHFTAGDRSLSSINGTTSDTGHFSGSMSGINVSYNFTASYVRADSRTLDTLAGTWATADGLSSFVFDDKGNFTGSDDSGCNYEARFGRVANLTDSHTQGVYVAEDATVTSCDFADSYDLFAIWKDEALSLMVVGDRSAGAFVLEQ